MILEEIYPNEKERVMFLKGLIRLSKADGQVSEEEREFFSDAAKGMGVSESSVQSLERLFINNQKISLEFRNKKQALFFFRDAIQLCYIDNDYSQAERDEVSQIAKELSISLENIRKIEDWVQKGMEWQAEGSTLLELE